jgi:O-antigen/teichoic acid export membrane protein
MFSSGLKYTYLSIFPIILIIIIFSREGLGLWLGSEIASKSFIVLQLLAFGSILNSLSYIPSALIQAAGRPDLTAKLNIIELPLYLFALYFLIKYFGIEGAAFAYILRTMFDSFFLLFLSAKLLSINQLIKRLFYFILGTLPILLFFIFFTPDLILKCILSFIMIFLFFYYGWKIILDINERNFILKYLKCKFFNNTIN